MFNGEIRDGFDVGDIDKYPHTPGGLETVLMSKAICLQESPERSPAIH